MLFVAVTAAEAIASDASGVAVIWALVALMRSGDTQTDANRPSAEEILKERFSRGEIDASEYSDRIVVLHGKRAKTST
jgi:uncharacterized membrane protein